MERKRPRLLEVLYRNDLESLPLQDLSQFYVVQALVTDYQCVGAILVTRVVPEAEGMSRFRCLPGIAHFQQSECAFCAWVELLSFQGRTYLTEACFWSGSPNYSTQLTDKPFSSWPSIFLR